MNSNYIEIISMADTSLYNSTICRLCGENNINGEFLYTSENEESYLSSLINRYLPIKINNDGKLPRTICPGCNIQLEATVQFFELMVEGQRKIREMWKYQLEYEEKKVRENEQTKFIEETPILGNLERSDKKEYFSDQIFIKVLPDGSMYAAEHDLSLKIEGLEKPKRKRGRPPKVQIEEIDDKISDEMTEIGSQEEEQEDDEFDGDGRRKRRRKAPKRYSEAVQGKELERIFKEEGVIDDEDDGGGHNNKSEELKNIATPDNNEEIIGHLETEEGKDLGKLVTVNRGRGRGRPKLRRRKTKFTCNICQKGFSQRSRYIIHKSSHKGIKYGCIECNKEFSNSDHLSLHEKKCEHNCELNVNSDNGNENTNMLIEEKIILTKENFVKDVFIETIKKEEGISETVLSVDKEESVNLNCSNEYEMIDELDKTYDCDECNNQFSTKELLDEHVILDHSENEKLLFCSFCDKSFAFKFSLKSHLLTHETEKSEKGFPCDICGKVLNHPSSVVYHKEAEHNDGRRFVCNKCNKSFKHKQLLQRHQLVHSEDRPYTCKSCNAKFKTKANLINHGSTHTGEKKYTCELCQHQFAHKTSLTLHHRWHNGEKPFTCNVCHKGFSQNGNLQEHIRIHTGEKPYSCDECDRKFTTSSQFKLHVKRHTGERPWKCEYCNKSFLHKDTWKCHVRRHKGDRPFQCHQCDKKFTEQWALKKHLRMHTGEKPYTCDICDKKFADCSNLTKHKKVHRHHKVLEINDTTKTSESSEIWHVLSDPQSNDDNYLDDQMSQVIETEDGSEDGVSQLVYISYTDPDDPNQSKTMNLSMIDDKEENSTSINQSLSNLKIINPNVANKDKFDVQDTQEKIEMNLSDPNLQLQITDEHGNPFPITIQDARQLLSGGQFVSQWNNGQMIKVQSDDGSEELCEGFGIHVTEAISFNQVDNTENQEEKTPESNDSIQIDNCQEIVKDVEESDDILETVTHVHQLDHNEAIAITEDEQTYAFMTQNGERIRMMRSTYTVDPNLLDCDGEYMSIG